MSVPSRGRPWGVGAGVLAGLLLVAVVAWLVVDRQRSDPTPREAGGVSSSELAGEWSGTGSLARCAGFDDEDCSGTRSIRLTVDCSGKRCVVTPFDRSYGSPPLRVEDGVQVAVGPLPAAAAPTCGGDPTTSGRWGIELRLLDGRLTGRYEESTIQGFDCGATSIGWAIALEHG